MIDYIFPNFKEVSLTRTIWTLRFPLGLVGLDRLPRLLELSNKNDWHFKRPRWNYPNFGAGPKFFTPSSWMTRKI